jgi:hypothetical protein
VEIAKQVRHVSFELGGIHFVFFEEDGPDFRDGFEFQNKAPNPGANRIKPVIHAGFGIEDGQFARQIGIDLPWGGPKNQRTERGKIREIRFHERQPQAVAQRRGRAVPDVAGTSNNLSSLFARDRILWETLFTLEDVDADPANVWTVGEFFGTDKWNWTGWQAWRPNPQRLCSRFFGCKFSASRESSTEVFRAADRY